MNEDTAVVRARALELRTHRGLVYAPTSFTARRTR